MKKLWTMAIVLWVTLLTCVFAMAEGTQATEMKRLSVVPGDTIVLELAIEAVDMAGMGAGDVHFDAADAPLTCMGCKVEQTENEQVLASWDGLSGQYGVIGKLVFVEQTVRLFPGKVGEVTFKVNEHAAPGEYMINVWGSGDVTAASAGLLVIVEEVGQLAKPTPTATATQAPTPAPTPSATEPQAPAPTSSTAVQQTPTPVPEATVPPSLSALTKVAAAPGDTVVVHLAIEETNVAGKGAGYVYFDATDVPGTCVECVEKNQTRNVIVAPPPPGISGRFAVVNMGPLTTGKIGEVKIKIDADAVPGEYVINVWGEEDATKVSGGLLVKICLHSDAVDVPMIPPTCVETGRTAGTCCAECGTVLTGHEEIPYLGHDTEVVQSAPTCTEEGCRDGQRCTRCGDMVVEPVVVPPTGHAHVGVVTTAAECTKTGIKTFTCSNCGDQYTEVIPAAGHDYEERVEEEPACVKDGVMRYTCRDCGDSYTTVMPATGHTEEILPVVLPTCTAAGLTEGKHCVTCGVVFTAQQEIAALGHVDGETVVMTEPTTVTPGKLATICSVCGDIAKTEEIPQLRFAGDANMDGMVDIFDALLVLQYAVAWDVELNVANADVNGDNAADIFDALLILQYAVGWDVELK